MSCSTPKIPLDKRLSSFIRKIDSFSFEEPNPVFSSSSESSGKTQESSEKERTVQQEVKTQQEEEEIIHSQHPPQHPEYSVVQLREGREYRRPRANSTPITANDKRLVPAQVFSNNIEEKKNRVNKENKMESVHQVICNIIPLFSGDQSPNSVNEVSVLLTCCQLAYQSLGTNEEKEIFIKLLPTKLRGRALQLAQGRNFASLDEFTNFIKENFSENKSYITLNNELRSVQQLPGESLVLYLSRVNSLLEMCKQKAREQFPHGAQVIEQELEEIAVNSYKMGTLNPNHKYYLFQNPEKTLSALTPVIKRLDETEKLILFPILNSMQQTFPPTTQLVSNYFPHANPYNSLNMLQSSGITQNFQNDSSIGLNTPLLSNNLVANPFSSFNNNPQGNSTGTNRRNIHNNKNFRTSRRNSIHENKSSARCWLCNQVGHISRDCNERNVTPFTSTRQTYATYNTTYPNRQERYINSQKKGDSNYAVNRSRMQQVNLVREEAQQEECAFCLQPNHHESKCLARERWEKRQLELRLQSLESENGDRAAVSTPARL